MLAARPPATVKPMKIQAASDCWGDATMALVRDRLAAGALVAYPTETFYGLGCDPRAPAAVRALLLAKGRPANRPLPVIAATARDARALVTLDEGAARVWNRLTLRFWPGPLTLAAPAVEGLAPGVLAGGNEVAVRVSSSITARRLATLCGGIIVATSANRSGEPPSCTAEEVARSLGAAVDLLVDGGTCPGGAPSTVVSVHGGRLQVLRPGAIDEGLLQAAIDEQDVP